MENGTTQSQNKSQIQKEIQKIVDKQHALSKHSNRSTVYAFEPFSKYQDDQCITDEYQQYFDCSPRKYGDKKNSWIKHGSHDKIPNLLLSLYRRSGLHKSCINTKAKLAIGGGVDFAIPKDYFLKERKKDGQYVLFKMDGKNTLSPEQLIQKARLYAKNIHADTFWKKAFMQLSLFGGYYGLRFIQTNAEAQSSLKHLHVEPFCNMRLGTKRKFFEGEFESEFLFVSDDFTKATLHKVCPALDYYKGNTKHTYGNVGKIHNLKSFEASGQYEHPVYGKAVGFFEDYRPYYPTADYESLSGLRYIEIHEKNAVYDFNSIDKSFAINHIIVCNRQKLNDPKAEEEQKEKDKKIFKKNHKGEHGSSTLMVWAEPLITETDIKNVPPFTIIEIPHDTNIDRYKDLRQRTDMEVLSNHGIVTGEIIGMPSNSVKKGFSSQSEYLITAFEMLYWGRIRPMQELVLNDLQQELLLADIPVNVVAKVSKPTIRQATENLLMYAWGRDEIRAMHGSEKMSEEVKEELAKELEARINKGVNKRNKKQLEDE